MRGKEFVLKASFVSMLSFCFFALLSCGGARDPSDTSQGIIFELNEHGVMLSRCRGGSKDRVFIDKSVVDNVRSKQSRDKVNLKAELGTYSCLEVGSLVRMVAPGLATSGADLLRIDKIQVIDRRKVGRYQARRAGFSTIQEFNAYLDTEAQRKEEKGFPVYNKGLVTIVHFTYLEGTSQNSSSPGGGSGDSFFDIKPEKVTTDGQRLSSCATHKSDWKDIWLREDFSSRICEILGGQISLHMSHGGYSCNKVGSEIVLMAGKTITLGKAVVREIEVLEWAKLSPDQISHSGLNEEQLQSLKTKAQEKNPSAFVTLTHFEFHKEGEMGCEEVE